VHLTGLRAVAMSVRKQVIPELFSETAALLRVNLKQSFQDVVPGAGRRGAKSLPRFMAGRNQLMDHAAATVNRPG